jgi:hypothetical protein
MTEKFLSALFRAKNPVQRTLLVSKFVEYGVSIAFLAENCYKESFVGVVDKVRSLALCRLRFAKNRFRTSRDFIGALVPLFSNFSSHLHMRRNNVRGPTSALTEFLRVRAR